MVTAIQKVQIALDDASKSFVEKDQSRLLLKIAKDRASDFIDSVCALRTGSLSRADLRKKLSKKVGLGDEGADLVLEVIADLDQSILSSIQTLAGLPPHKDTVEGWNLAHSALLADPQTRTELLRSSSSPQPKTMVSARGEYGAFLNWLVDPENGLSPKVRMEAIARFDMYVTSEHAKADMLDGLGGTKAADELHKIFKKLRTGQDIDGETIKIALDARWSEIMIPMGVKNSYDSEGGEILIAHETSSVFSLRDNTAEGSARVDVAIRRRSAPNEILLAMTTSDENIDDQGEQMAKYALALSNTAHLSKRLGRSLLGISEDTVLSAASLYAPASVFPSRAAALNNLLPSKDQLKDKDIRALNTLSHFAALSDSGIPATKDSALVILAAKHAAIGMGGTEGFTTYGPHDPNRPNRSKSVLIRDAVNDVSHALSVLARINWPQANAVLGKAGSSLLLDTASRSIEGLLHHWPAEARALLLKKNALENIKTIVQGTGNSKLKSQWKNLNTEDPEWMDVPSSSVLTFQKEQEHIRYAVKMESWEQEAEVLLGWRLDQKDNPSTNAVSIERTWIKKFGAHGFSEREKWHLWDAVLIGLFTPEGIARYKDTRDASPLSLDSRGQQAFVKSHPEIQYVCEGDGTKVNTLLGRINDLAQLMKEGKIKYPISDWELRLAAISSKEEWESNQANYPFWSMQRFWEEKQKACDEFCNSDASAEQKLSARKQVDKEINELKKRFFQELQEKGDVLYSTTNRSGTRRTSRKN